jgi:hypothetical protein
MKVFGRVSEVLHDLNIDGQIDFTNMSPELLECLRSFRAKLLTGHVEGDYLFDSPNGEVWQFEICEHVIVVKKSGNKAVWLNISRNLTSSKISK